MRGCGFTYELLSNCLDQSIDIWYVITNIKADLVYHDKWIEADNLVEIRIWSVPSSYKRPYGYKYTLVYIRSGNRIVGYDNAEGKDDHRHYGDKDEPYGFQSIEKLFEDFYNDVRRFWK